MAKRSVGMFHIVRRVPVDHQTAEMPMFRQQSKRLHGCSAPQKSEHESVEQNDGRHNSRFVYFRSADDIRKLRYSRQKSNLVNNLRHYAVREFVGRAALWKMSSFSGRDQASALNPTGQRETAKNIHPRLR
ncbi:hypothetical protein [Chelativorans sp.]|uniref:hypothetical protein n=1 Tax=Chelativorans sp. TaxID=2203393 RepID=UPI002810B283|nr:hypothetical protein [Chelativorans sp.]